VIWFAAEEKRLLASTSGPVGQLIARLCVKVESAAKARCPVDTGRLRSSITWRIESEHDGVVGIVGTNVEYAIYVHQGTRRMAGRPFLLEGLKQVLG
jgi:HK97 gp10 family phage protein